MRMRKMSRRSALRLVAGSVGVLLAGPGVVRVATTAPYGQQGQGGNPIHEENQRPGTTGWESGQLRHGRREPVLEERPGSGVNAAEVGNVSASAWVDTPIRGYAGQAMSIDGRKCTG